MTDDIYQDGLATSTASRREMLRRAAAVGGMLTWATPTVQTIAARAAYATTSPPPVLDEPTAGGAEAKSNEPAPEGISEQPAFREQGIVDPVQEPGFREQPSEQPTESQRASGQSAEKPSADEQSTATSDGQTKNRQRPR